MYKYKLVSCPLVDIGLFPLYLKPPDSISSGGFRLPILSATPSGTRYIFEYQYSPIDLFVAGLEAHNNNIEVHDLSKFFSEYRDKPNGMLSEYDTYVTYLRVDSETIKTESVSKIKTRIQSEKNFSLLNTMRQNAPFTFKYMNV